MKPLAFTVTGALVALALSAGPTSVWAQGRPGGGGGGGQGGGGGAQGGGTRENSGGGNTGTAVSRGGGNAGGESGGGSSVGSSGSSGGSSGSGWSGPSGISGGGSSTGVSRPGGARMRGEGGSRVDPRSLGNGQQRGEAIPRGARPNTGNPVTGTAVAREGRPPSGGGGGNIPVYPGYYPPYWGGGYGGYYGGYYPYWGYPYGWSGLYFYSPFWWGYGYPYDYGYGYGYGGYGGYAGPSGYAYGADESYMQGSLKLKVKPREAEVFADGYFVGRVDDFDGSFQELNLKAGGHRIEIRAEGFEPITFEVQVDPRQTITYRGELKKVK